MELEFKGTKGSWSDMSGDNDSIDIILSNEATISIDRHSRYNGKYACPREEMEANARLISKSPEMLEMLQKINNIENASFGLKSFNVEDLKRKLGRLIKEATEV